MKEKSAESIGREDDLTRYYLNRYNQLEDEFIKMEYYIPITSDFDAPNYKFGSPKFADLLTSCCQDVESLFDILIEKSVFDDIDDIEDLRKKFKNNPSINTAKPILNVKGVLSEQKVETEQGLVLQPFCEFKNGSNPSWFKLYSKQKHQRLVLIKETTFIDAINSFAAFTILSSQLMTTDKFPEYRFFTSLNKIVGYSPTDKFPYLNHVQNSLY